jgi:hypothetical protein
MMKRKLLALVFALGVSSLAVAESATKGDEKEIRALIEDLVFVHGKASDTPLLSPGIGGNDDVEYKRQFEKCQRAFAKLTEFRDKALPFLAEHLGDKRPSIHFRNHYLGHSVGDACYWNIYLQLQDRPKNYSSYGYQRKGRDGRSHPKPYWEGTPFDEAGGVSKWLEANKRLSYAEMQVKCLAWLLEREKGIGVPDAESYFENILPLEIRILERKAETGADVSGELQRLRSVLNQKEATAVPRELLPKKADGAANGSRPIRSETNRTSSTAGSDR